jgi:hypothetical protein
MTSNDKQNKKSFGSRIANWFGEWIIIFVLIIGAGWYFGVGPVDEFVDLTGFGACDRLAKDIASEFDEVLSVNDAVAFERQPKGRYSNAEKQFDSQKDAPVVKCVGEAVLPTGQTERVAIYKWRLDGPSADDGQVNEDLAFYYAVEPLTPGDF